MIMVISRVLMMAAGQMLLVRRYSCKESLYKGDGSLTVLNFGVIMNMFIKS